MGMLFLASAPVSAQTVPSVAGTYRATWASGNSWRMTLRQSGSNVSATFAGKARDGSATAGTGSGSINNGQINMRFKFSRGGEGVFAGLPTANGISASFRFRANDSASFTRC